MWDNLDSPNDGQINSEFSPFLIRNDVNMWNSEDLQQFSKPAATILQQQNHSLVPPSVRSELNPVTIHLYGYKMHTSVVMNSKKTASLQEEWSNMLFCQKSLLLTWYHSIWKDNVPCYFVVIDSGQICLLNSDTFTFEKGGACPMWVKSWGVPVWSVCTFGRHCLGHPCSCASIIH